MTLDARCAGAVFTTPHGVCAVVDVPDSAVVSAEADLPAEERQFASTFTGARRRDFVAGRTALHQLIPSDVPIVSDDRGAPRLPAGTTGSISHKGLRAVAIIAPSDLGYVGIDIERATAPRGDIARRILTAREPAVTGKWLTRVFAIKEAIYKAVDPVVHRHVGFHEVEIINEMAWVVDVAALPVRISMWCVELDGYWLATARTNESRQF